jgi:hypothetical protein
MITKNTIPMVAILLMYAFIILNLMTMYLKISFN